MSARELSDNYWGRVIDYGPYALTYDSLNEITRDVHLIVRGRITNFRSGQIQTFSGAFGSYRTVFGIVTVDEVLKGTPAMRSGDAVEVAELGWPGMSIADLPNEPVLLFLMSYAQLREEEGVGPSDDPDDIYYYGLPNGYQGALRSIDGVVDIVDGPQGWEGAFGPYPSGLDGQAFDAIVEHVRGIVGQ